MRGAPGRPRRGARGLIPPAPSPPALVRISGAPSGDAALFVAALAEELRRLGHRVARAEARPEALVVELASGGRVAAAPPGEAGAVPEALARLARSLDPQLELLLVVDGGGPGAQALPTVELRAPGAPRRGAGAGSLAAATGPGSAPRVAAIIERRLLGRRAGRSLDAAWGLRRAPRALSAMLPGALAGVRSAAASALGRLARRG